MIRIKRAKFMPAYLEPYIGQAVDGEGCKSIGGQRYINCYLGGTLELVPADCTREVDDEIYHGWISAGPGDKYTLEELGVTVGKYDYEAKCFTDCCLTERTFKRLGPLWGWFIWGLDDGSGRNGSCLR